MEMTRLNNKSFAKLYKMNATDEKVMLEEVAKP